MTVTATSRSTKWRRFAYVIIAVLCIIGMGASMITNLAVSGQLSWAWYPILANAYAMALLTPLLAKKNRPAYWLAALIVFTLPFLYFLDIITPGHDWFTALALPIFAMNIAAICICFFISKLLRNRWYIAAVFVFVLGAIVSPITNLLVDSFISQFAPVFAIFTYINIISTIVLCVVISITLIGVGRRKKTMHEHDTSAEANAN